MRGWCRSCWREAAPTGPVGEGCRAFSTLRVFLQNGLDRTGIERFVTNGVFLSGGGLTDHEGVGPLVVPCKECGSMVPALVAIDAVGAHIKATGGVLGVSVMGICHETRIRRIGIDLSDGMTPDGSGRRNL